MSKRFLLICLFTLSIAGLKAQTYCYHLYKHYDNMDNAGPRDSYQYFTFEGNWLYPSEYPSPYTSINGQVVCQSFLYNSKITNEDGDLYYGYCDPKDLDFYYGDILTSTSMSHTFYYFVSKDKMYISYFRSFGNGTNVTEDCYERCDNKNCLRGNETNTRVQRRRRR